MTRLSPAEATRAADFAREWSARAGRVLCEHYGRLDPAAIHTKSSARDLVTAADLAAERCLVDALREHFPGHAIESEEAVQDPMDSRPRWLLDPLDGTVNFVHGLPMFSVSMGLYSWDPQLRQWVPEVGVVHVPLLAETFHAQAGAGAYLNDRRLTVSTTANLSDAILATGFPYRRNELEHNNLANFNRFFLDVRGIRRFGSAAIDLAYVAAGRFDGYWELHLAPHDLAAGALLVREAGGLVTDCDGGQAWLRAGHVVAAGPGLHRQILERIVH